MSQNKRFTGETSSEVMEDSSSASRKIPSLSSLLHILWLRKWLILGLWLLFSIPAGTLLSIYDLPRSYTATTIMRFPQVVGAQTNVMRDVAITEGTSIISIFNSYQVLDASIRKLGLRMRITSKETFKHDVFRELTYGDNLGPGTYTVLLEGSGTASISYKPNEGNSEYKIFSGPLLSGGKLSVPGLEMEFMPEFLKDHEKNKIELELKSLEETFQDLRKSMTTKSLGGGGNFEIKLKDRDPVMVAEILNTLRDQFLEVYYGTTEVQDVGILVQMEKDLALAKDRLEKSQDELSRYYADHPELVQQPGANSGDNLTYLDTRQQIDNLERRKNRVEETFSAKEINATPEKKFYWASELLASMVEAGEPKANILRASLAEVNNRQAVYERTLAPGHPKIVDAEKEKDTLYTQIEETESRLVRNMDKDLSALRLKLVGSAPKAVSRPPVKVTLELERLNNVNQNNQNIYDRLLESYNRAKLVTGSEFFKVSVVDPARPAIYEPPSLKTRLLIAGTAVLLLLFVTPALILGWSILFVKVWTKDDVEKLLNMKLLGAISFNPNAGGKANSKNKNADGSDKQKANRPGKRKGNSKDKDREDEAESVADLNAPKPTRPPDPLLLFYGSAYRIEDLEAYRIIREEAENFFRNARTGKCCLMVTSTQPNEGKTMITSNLAMTFARKGKRTLLIDADFRLGRVDKVFNMPGATGLDELLSQTDLSDAQFLETVTLCYQPTMQRNLIVVPRKKFNPNAGEMVSSDRFKAFIRMVREQFDVVLIDTPPVMITPEPLSLAEVTDGVIYVCRSGNTSVSDSLEAVEILEERGVRVAAVLNGVRISPFIQNRYTKYSYYYGQPKVEEPGA